MAAYNLVKISFCMDICISEKLWQCKNAHSSNLHLSYTVKYLQITKADFQQLMCDTTSAMRVYWRCSLCRVTFRLTFDPTSVNDSGLGCLQWVTEKKKKRGYVIKLLALRCNDVVKDTDLNHWGKTLHVQDGFLVSYLHLTLAWGCGKNKQRTRNCSHTRTNKPTLSR